MPEDDNGGYLNAPHELAAAQLLQLTQACVSEEKVWLVKEVRAHNLAQRENAVVRLAAVAPLVLPAVLPSST